MEAPSIEELQKKITRLELELRDASYESLQAGYEQALEDLRGVCNGVMEVTRALGPAAGLEYLLGRLAEKDVDTITVPSEVPLDWLSRWEVRLADD